MNTDFGVFKVLDFVGSQICQEWTLMKSQPNLISDLHVRKSTSSIGRIHFSIIKINSNHAHTPPLLRLLRT